MRKKVAIASCYYQNNYGSMLQAYATQVILDNMNIANETIDISGLKKEINVAKYKYFLKASLTSDILIYKFGNLKNLIIRKMSKGNYAQLAKVRVNEFETFRRERICMSEKFKTKAELSEKCERKYSAVIVGSDQLWLPGNISGDFFTLNFVPQTVNSIAYATSFGQSFLPKDIEKKAKVFLAKIRHIGVREETGKALVKKLTGRNVGVVCDPTLLLTGQEWLSILGNGNFKAKDNDYIFCYFLGKNPLHREFAKKVKEETGLKIVALTHLDEIVTADKNYADENPYDVGPIEFVRLIYNAKYILTDSFHCSVFSVLFEKDFYTFRRYPNTTKHSTNSRVENLLQKLGLSNRLLDAKEDVREILKMKIDYQDVLTKLARFREKSFEYLQQALLNNGSTDL